MYLGILGFEIVGFKVKPSLDLTLQNFLDLDLGRWNDQITEIATIAANEYNIESSLRPKKKVESPYYNDVSWHMYSDDVSAVRHRFQNLRISKSA